jgi:glucokinase
MEDEIAQLIRLEKVILPEAHDTLDTDATIKLIQSNHPDVMKIFHQQLDYLACGIETIINTIDPDLIVLGGEIARLGTPLCDGIKSRLLRPVNLKTSSLGNNAGLIGAALLALEKLTIL